MENFSYLIVVGLFLILVAALVGPVANQTTGITNVFGPPPVLDANNGFATNSGSASCVVTGLQSTTAADVIVATLMINDTTTTVSSITGNGLTWTLRSSKVAAANLQEFEYFAVATAFPTTPSITFTTSNTKTAKVCSEFAFSGVNLDTPFDKNALLPQTSTGTVTPATGTYSTSTAKDTLLFLLADCKSSGTDSEAPPGFTVIGGSGAGIVSTNCTSALSNPDSYLPVTTIQSATSYSAVLTGTLLNWVLIADALQPFSQNAANLVNSPGTTSMLQLFPLLLAALGLIVGFGYVHRHGEGI